MKNLIFDWSGVVKDAVLTQLWVSNMIFKKYGVKEITLEEFKENWEQPYINFYKKYLPEEFAGEKQEQAYKEAMLDTDCPKSNATLGMVELIKELKSKGHFLAVVSSDLAELLHKEIKEYGLESLFDQVVTDVPDKLEAVERIIGSSDLNLVSTAFIGDSNHEIDVAKKIGIKSIAVTWGYTSESRLKSLNPDHVAHDVEELKKAINNDG